MASKKTTIKEKATRAVKLVSKAASKVKKVIQRTIIKDVKELPLHEREMIFRAELQKLMDKYAIGLSIATVDLKAKILPTIEA